MTFTSCPVKSSLLLGRVISIAYRLYASVAQGQNFSSSVFFLLLLFCFFRAETVAYGSSQARSQVEAATAGLCRHSHSKIRATSVTYTAAHGNTRSFNLLSKARNRTLVLMDKSGLLLLSHDGNSQMLYS